MALSLYIVKRTDDVDYDQMESVVVAAGNALGACRIASTCRGETGTVWYDGEITLIGTALEHTQPGILHENYKRG